MGCWGLVIPPFLPAFWGARRSFPPTSQAQRACHKWEQTIAPTLKTLDFPPEAYSATFNNEVIEFNWGNGGRDEEGRGACRDGCVCAPVCLPVPSLARSTPPTTGLRLIDQPTNKRSQGRCVKLTGGFVMDATQGNSHGLGGTLLFPPHISNTLCVCVYRTIDCRVYACAPKGWIRACSERRLTSRPTSFHPPQHQAPSELPPPWGSPSPPSGTSRPSPRSSPSSSPASRPSPWSGAASPPPRAQAPRPRYPAPRPCPRQSSWRWPGRTSGGGRRTRGCWRPISCEFAKCQEGRVFLLGGDGRMGVLSLSLFPLH